MQHLFYARFMELGHHWDFWCHKAKQLLCTESVFEKLTLSYEGFSYFFFYGVLSERKFDFWKTIKLMKFSLLSEETLRKKGNEDLKTTISRTLSLFAAQEERQRRFVQQIRTPWAPLFQSLTMLSPNDEVEFLLMFLVIRAKSQMISQDRKRQE